MLKSLTLKNWKSFGETRNTVKLAPLTLFVGPNASGKSNALDALRFLQGSALDYPLGDVLRGRWEGQREIWPAIRGRVVEAARGTLTSFELTTEWKLDKDLSHIIAVDTASDAVLETECVYEGSEWVFDSHGSSLGKQAGRQAGGSFNVAVRTKGKGKPSTQTLSASRSVLGQVNSSGREDKDALRQVDAIRTALRTITFLDIQPSRMRDYQPMHAQALGSSGENISPKLQALSDSQRADVLGWLSELCAPNLTGISFDRTQLKEVMFYLIEGELVKISARSVSDGTLRFLGLVTALLSAEPGSVIVLEEPDVGLHPARIHLLAELLEQTTQNGIQVVATTHSPTLLAHLSTESLRHVVAMGRGDDGATVCSRVGDLEHFETLRNSKQLDHLVSTGWIERAL